MKIEPIQKNWPAADRKSTFQIWRRPERIDLGVERLVRLFEHSSLSFLDIVVRSKGTKFRIIFFWQFHLERKPNLVDSKLNGLGQVNTPIPGNRAPLSLSLTIYS